MGCARDPGSREACQASCEGKEEEQDSGQGVEHDPRLPKEEQEEQVSSSHDKGTTTNTREASGSSC